MDFPSQAFIKSHHTFELFQFSFLTCISVDFLDNFDGDQQLKKDFLLFSKNDRSSMVSGS